MSEHQPNSETIHAQEMIPIPEDSYEVEENTYAVAAASEGRRHIYTGGLYDCKAIIGYVEASQTAVMAHMSVVDQLEPVIARIVGALGVDPSAIRTTIVTGSDFDAANDTDLPADDGLKYPSAEHIEAQLRAQGVSDVNIDSAEKSDKTRAVAIDLANGAIYQVDESKIIDYNKLDSSRNQVIEPKLTFDT